MAEEIFCPLRFVQSVNILVFFNRGYMAQCYQTTSSLNIFLHYFASSFLEVEDKYSSVVAPKIVRVNV